METPAQAAGTPPLFEQTTDPILIYSLDGVVVDANPACCTLFGYAHDELIGVHVVDLVHVEHRSSAEAVFTETLATGLAQASAVCVRRDGSTIHTEIEATTFTHAGRPQVLALVRDVTEQVRAEARLRDAEEQYRTIYESTSDGLIINDPQSGLVVEANPAACRMHGYTYDEFIGIHAAEFIHPDYHWVFVDFSATIASGGTYTTQAIDVRNDGTVFPVEVHGSPVMYRGRRHILAVVRDITDRVEAENKYRSVFESTSDCLTIYNEQGFVVDVNPAACDVTGYRRDEFIGLHYKDLALPEYHDLIEQSFHVVLGGGTMSGRGVSVGKGGKLFPTEGHSTSIMYEGKPHVLMVVRDITTQVEAEEHLEQRVADRTRELTALLEVSRNLVSTLELNRVLEAIFDQLKVVLDFVDASIFTVQGSDLCILRNQGPLPPEVLQTFRTPIAQNTLAGMVVLEDRPVVIDDVQGKSMEALAFREAVGPLFGKANGAIRSWLAVPMRVGSRIIGALTASHSQPGFYGPHHVALAQAVAQQASLALENARLYGDAQNVAVMEERQRLSRELHDSVSQSLYSIALAGKTARALLEPGSRAQEPLEFVLTQAERALAEMRALIFALRPEVLEQEGLVGSLRLQGEALRGRGQFEVVLELGDEPELPFSMKEALYRIAQEALHNIVKHARATEVTIAFSSTPNDVTLEIHDNGVGFDTNASFPGHVGLHSMKERAERVGGTLCIESDPGHGTCMRVHGPRTSL